MAYKFSPLQVRNQEFTKAIRGYKPEEVRQFLTRVADFINDLLHENRRLTNEVESLKRRIVELEQSSNSLKEMVDQSAQKIMNLARQKADELIAEAENKAQLMLKEASLTVEKKREELYELTGIYEAYKRQLLFVLKGMISSVQKFEESVEMRGAKKATEKLGAKIGALRPLDPITALKNTTHRRRKAFFEKAGEG